jgi:DNA-binding XRE family transcriptional regulator
MMNHVLEYRNSQGLTQEQLAKRWNIAQHTISRLETGVQGLGSQESLRLSKLSGLPLEAFILKPHRPKHRRRASRPGTRAASGTQRRRASSLT